LHFEIDEAQLLQDREGDGIFPLVTNVVDWSPEDILRAYKRQPIIEKRFSQLKTDFEVASIYLKDISRIQALLCVYFFVLIVQTLLERELRRAMAREKLEALPLYPEGRACKAPTTRRVIDLFEGVERHTLSGENGEQVFVTKLTDTQHQILTLLGVAARTYGR
jgi:transposase